MPMRRAWLLAVTGLACSGTPHAPVAPSSKPSHLPAPLLAVGSRPRALAIVDLRDPRLRALLAELAPLLPAITGHSATGCDLALDQLESLRVAIGEPLKVSAEIDGPIDAKAVACALGESMFADLTKAGFAVRDRPGGIAIERDVEPARATATATELVARCAGHPSCIVGRLGPAAREVWFELAHDGGTTLHARLSGPGFASASALAAAIDELKATTLAFRALAARSVGGALVIDSPWVLAAPELEQLVAAIEANLVETFPIPRSSAMVPTLVAGDQVLAMKGRLRGPIVPGMVVVHRWSDGRAFMKRVVAAGGETVAETERGIVIDGMPLVTEDVPGDYAYAYDFGPGTPQEQSGKVVREHLRDRSYLTLHRMSAAAAFARSRQRGSSGSWTVPRGTFFVLGDNRDDSTDSRYLGAIPEESVVARVASIGFALRDGMPDWERMGSTVE
jgi:signal peptidase I